MIFAMSALMGFTLMVAGRMLYLRIQAVRDQTIKMSYFRVYETKGEATLPPLMTQASCHFSNLFEMPTLFYTIGVLAIAMHISSPWVDGLAWGYVVLRVIHGVIHLTYNNVIHRMLAFLSSSVVLVALWVLVVSELV
jgi:hypothetical protein